MQMSRDVAKPFQPVPYPTSGTQPLTQREPTGQVEKTTFDHIAVYLGPATSRSAIRSCAQRAVGRDPDDLEPGDLPRFLAALRPMLETLLGGANCRILLRRIERDLTS